MLKLKEWLRRFTHLLRRSESLRTLKQEVEASLWQERLLTLLCVFFGCSALVLCGIGVYSALAYSVRRRLREFGIRMALGAQQADIVWTASGRLAAAIAVGLAGGLAASAVLLRLIRNFLFQVDPLDVSSFTLAAVILLLCSVTAALIPTWRAIRVEPAVALRQK